MRTIFFFILALVTLLPPAFAAETDQPCLLVAPLQVTRNLLSDEPEVGTSTADLLSGLLVRRYRFPGAATLIETARRTGISTAMLHEDLEGCAQFARQAGVDLVLTGRLHSFGRTIVLHLRLVEIPEEGPAIPKAMLMRKCDGLEGIPDLLPEFVKAFGLVSQPETKPVGASPAPGIQPRPRAGPKPKPTEADVEKLVKGLTSEDAGVRFSSAIELGRTGDTAAVKVLMMVARSDRDMFVRRAAIRSLGELGDPAAVPALIEALGDKDYFVAVTANQAILNLTEHDCGIKDGLSAENLKEVVENARAWWESREE